MSDSTEKELSGQVLSVNIAKNLEHTIIFFSPESQCPSSFSATSSSFCSKVCSSLSLDWLEVTTCVTPGSSRLISNPWIRIKGTLRLLHSLLNKYLSTENCNHWRHINKWNRYGPCPHVAFWSTQTLINKNFNWGKVLISIIKKKLSFPGDSVVKNPPAK